MATIKNLRLQATIGIECHVQLKTATKLFAAVSNDARSAQPNTLISHICLGMPGALPVLNEKAVEYAVRAAFAFGTVPQTYSYFERKHYFYPDLPKGYQITQLSHPIVKGGFVEIIVGTEKRQIRLNRVQMEEDAGKSTHPVGGDYSLVDLNRAGTPLLEIVSEPDMHTALEAKAYARELYLLMRYADVSDADLYHGNMRFDVNVSVSDNPSKLGTRTETKNLNSFKAVEKAAEYEIKRQRELLEKGMSITQETRGWDESKQKTVSQRGKEEAHDYRYFPEPDIPPVELTEEYIQKIKQTMPILPVEWRQRLAKLGLDDATIETFLDNKVLLDKLFGEELHGAAQEDLKRVADWLVNVIIGELVKAEDINSEDAESYLKIPGNLTKLSRMVGANTVSSSAAKTILIRNFTNFYDPEKIAQELNLLQVSDADEIEELVKRVLNEYKQAAIDVQNGEMKAIGFLVGQVMKASKGKANPAMAQELIKKLTGV